MHESPSSWPSWPSWPLAFSQFQAFGLLLAYCLVYVLPLHAFADTRPSIARSRDSPHAIRARIRSVSFSTTGCSLVTFMLLLRSCRRLSPASGFGAGTNVFGCSPWHLMGYYPCGLAEAVNACSLTAILFAGPLYECLLIEGVWRQWFSRLQPLRELWTDWPTWRNLIAGPVTEECLFRSAAVPLLLLAGSSPTQIILFSPILFGLAHVHHFYEFRITNPQAPMGLALARSILQFSYTSLFGAYATFLFLRTGSLLAVVLVHVLCNSMGLPRFWGRLEPYWMSPDEFGGRRASVYTVIYYVLLLGGSIAWRQNLYSLTQSSMSLATF